MLRFRSIIVIAVLSAACVRADVMLETVTIVNAGNAADVYGKDEYGMVDYVYNIGKFELTAGQYAEFLNAVADDDTYGLYNTYMADPSGSWGCNIQRTGSSPDYSYSVAGDWADRPVNYVSWGDAARYANWLANGQPMGPQVPNTTEDGSYYLNGAVSTSELLAVTRESDATWVIPSEDEWYKAAYHKNDGVTGEYFDYPTSTDIVPSNDLTDPDSGNSANYFIYPGDYTIGSPYWRTEVGAFGNSASPYGTFDQAGNLWEWNESLADTSFRGVRGGSFYHVNNLHAEDRLYNEPASEHYALGFRVAEIPEPGTLGMLAIGALALLRLKPWNIGAI